MDRGDGEAFEAVAAGSEGDGVGGEDERGRGEFREGVGVEDPEFVSGLAAEEKEVEASEPADGFEVAPRMGSRRWRVSLAGRRSMSTAIKLREVAYPSLLATAA